jgi:hypothetical protein
LEEQYAAAKDVVALYYVNFTTGWLVLRPGETKLVLPKVPSIDQSTPIFSPSKAPWTWPRGGLVERADVLLEIVVFGGFRSH